LALASVPTALVPFALTTSLVMVPTRLAVPVSGSLWCRYRSGRCRRCRDVSAFCATQTVRKSGVGDGVVATPLPEAAEGQIVVPAL